MRSIWGFFSLFFWAFPFLPFAQRHLRNSSLQTQLLRPKVAQRTHACFPAQLPTRGFPGNRDYRVRSLKFCGWFEGWLTFFLYPRFFFFFPRPPLPNLVQTPFCLWLFFFFPLCLLKQNKRKTTINQTNNQNPNPNQTSKTQYEERHNPPAVLFCQISRLLLPVKCAGWAGWGPRLLFILLTLGLFWFADLL